MVVGVSLACECRRSRGTTRPRTAATSTWVCIMQAPHGYAYFQMKSSTRLWQAVATGSHVPARSRTAAALIGLAHLFRVEVLHNSCSADS